MRRCRDWPAAMPGFMSRHILSGPILATGGAGQVASALASAGGESVLRVGRPAFDFDAPDSILPRLRAAKPTLIVNAAAYTAVDKAESEPEAADRANRDGPARLAAYAAEAGIPLIHISNPRSLARAPLILSINERV